MCHRLTDKLGYDEPLKLECGTELGCYQIAYETYGEISERRDNAILICHALTGHQYVARNNPETGRPAWWNNDDAKMVGPGCPIDTNKYYVICSNILGGCMGSTGPCTINEETGKSWGMTFPVVTIGDMVKAQVELIKFLKIEKLLAVVGGSMGGMQVLEWIRCFSNRMKSAIAIATSCRQNVQNIAFHEAGRQAIIRDPKWKKGYYTERRKFPADGLSVARMIAHITYLSRQSLHEKFGRRLQCRNLKSYGFDTDFQIESYLNHQGRTFTERFDPNSYLFITRAVDYFDQSESTAGDLAEAYAKTLCDNSISVCLMSFSSDWMYPTEDSREIENALTSLGVNVERHEFETDSGHDSFLLKNELMEGKIRHFIDSQYYNLNY